MRTFDGSGRVTAKAAAHHDEFHTDKGATYRTRVIQFTPPNRYDSGDDIVIFGLNFYQPDPDETPVDLGPKRETTESDIVVIDKRGHVAKKQEPVTGETVVFAVHNKVTRDAKIYQVTVEKPTPDINGLFDPHKDEVSFKSDNVAKVHLPDGRTVTVEMLREGLQGEAVAEFDAALHKLKGAESQDITLSNAERAAARVAVSASSADGSSAE